MGRLTTIVCAILIVGVGRGASPDQTSTYSKSEIRALIRYLEYQRTGTDILSTLASHTDADIRGFAMLALARNADPRGKSTLERGLHDPASTVRLTAAFSLGELRLNAATPALLERVMKEPLESVRREIWKAIGRIGKPKDLGKLDRFEEQPEYATTLRNAGLVYARHKADVASQKWLKKALRADAAQHVAAAFYALARNRKHPIAESHIRRAIRVLKQEDTGAWRDAMLLLSRGAGNQMKRVLRIVKARNVSGHQRAMLLRGILRDKKNSTTAKLVNWLKRELSRLDTEKAWQTEEIHPVLVVAEGLVGRTLSKKMSATLTDILTALPRPNKPAPLVRRIERIRCAIEASMDNLKACPLPRTLTHAKALKKPSRFFMQYLTFSSPQIRMRVLHGLTADKTALAAVLPRALEDKDGPVVATAAYLASSKKINVPEVQQALDKAWIRHAPSKDPEVLIDLLRAISSLKTPLVKKAIAQALAMPNLGIRKAASKVAPIHGVTIPPRIDLKRPVDKAALKIFMSKPHEVKELATLTTSLGDIVISFTPHFAPATTKHIKALIQKGYYNGLSFHRIVANFVAQGGDPRGDGWGGPGYTIRCENNPIAYDMGVVGMALAGKDTGGSQFFIAVDPQPHLLGTYTVFGRVVGGMNTVRALVEGDRILKATVSKAP
jgi:cyclophilin family peptidyl-prolyl cis-trans isomerase